MTKDQQRWRDIWEYQSGEIETLAADPAIAARASLRAHYSRIGDLLGPETAGRVLELGCGPGRYVALLASLGHDVVGVDPHPNPTWDLITKHRAVEFRADVFAEELPFADSEFDHLACLGALLYFQNTETALAEMHRVTRPGGRAIFRTVNDHHLYTTVTGKRLDEAATNYYTPRTLRETLERAGFDVHRQFSYGIFPPFAAKTWWWLVNGQIPIAAQEAISALTPPYFRVNLIAFATRR